MVPAQQISREDAINLISTHEVRELSNNSRETLLLNWWTIDKEDSEFKSLPDELKLEISINEEPIDASRKLYDPLLKVALKRSYVGVLNSYLENRMARMGQDVRVTGDIESLEPCACCGYRTLLRLGWEICPVCFWQDDGVRDPDQISGANHGTLREAQQNFVAIGAANVEHLQHVLQDGRERYPRVARDRVLGSARIFASHYQLAICDDPKRIVSDSENWNDDKVARGFAGSPTFRMVGTEADLNDHWVELVLSERPPSADDWQRITCVDFLTESGNVNLMSVIDNQPAISAKVEPGEYAAYFAAQNIGIDQRSLGELNGDDNQPISDDELAARKDVEWYRVFIVSGRPAQRGRIVDLEKPVNVADKNMPED